MRHPEFPIISFHSVLLLLCSLPSHFRARSVCTLALIAWLTILNIVRGVNSFVWANNVIVRLEVWCDITTKLLIGFTYGVPLSALCICRHLEHISSNRQANSTISDKHLRMKIEGLLCFGLPIIFMALHYVVQGHRFDLFENVGCYPNTYSSTPGILVVWVPPLCISLVTLCYATAAFCHFLRRRIEFAAILQKSNSSMSPGRYFRLMAFAVTEVIWDSGVNSYILWFNVNFSGLRPWISWNNVHSNFSRVATFPTVFTPQFLLTQLIWQWWIVPISSILVFLFFSFGDEALSHYRLFFSWLRGIRLRQRGKTSTDHFSSLPTYTPRLPHPSNTHLTLSSIVDDTTGGALKPWDESLLKIPSIGDHVNPHPSSNNIFLAPTHYRPPSIGDFNPTSHTRNIRNSSSTSLCSSHISNSPADSQNWHSMDVSESSNFSAHGPPLSSFSPTITTNAEDQSYAPSVVLELPHVPSCPIIGERYSGSDFEINVSPVFTSVPKVVAEVASRSHEEASFTLTALDSLSPSSVECGHPLNGVRVTVEKDVA